jgi:hypothetical protein
VRGAAFEGALSVPSGRRDDRAAVHQQERGDIHTGCVRAGVHVFVCVRLEDMSDDQSTIVYCCKGTKKQSLSLLEINESVFRQSSDIGPAHPLYCTVLYCTVSSGHPIGVTVEDIINGRTLNHDVARRNIEAQYSPSQMAEFEGKAEVAPSI